MTISINPLSGAEYPLPDDVGERETIDSFRARHKDKPVVVVQGLGFVGAVMSLVCANALEAEYAVLGVDLATPAGWWRIASLREGVFPLTVVALVQPASDAPWRMGPTLPQLPQSLRRP